MTTTFIAICIFLCLVVVGLFTWGAMLWVGLRWIKAEHVSLQRIIVATLVCLMAGVFVQGVFLCLPLTTSQTTSLVLSVFEISVSVAVSALIIRGVFHIPLRRAVQAWLPTLLSSGLVISLSFLVIRPYLIEAFVIPTNSMAPTLLGNHIQGHCSECGAMNYGSPVPPGLNGPKLPRMICNNFHVTEASSSSNGVFPGDRIMVAKFLSPKRWDLIVFDFPEEPTRAYVMRLVGLPGERIHVQLGSVWADGKKLEPPSQLTGIEYLNAIPEFPIELSGTADNPALLADDEYFVLGDFSAQSADSRFWRTGAPGHHRYAVPKESLRGVVTHIYWPLSRLRILR